MSTSFLTGEMDVVDVTAEAIPSFSLPQQGLSSGTFTPFSEAMSVWREELCELQRSARIRNSQSLTDQTAQTPAHCSHETNINACRSGSRTGHIFAKSNENTHGALWDFDRCCLADQVLEQKWVAPERQFEEDVSQHSGLMPPELATPAYASINKEIENGRVVAYVLFIGVGSVVICSLCSLFRLLPLLVFPLLCLYRGNYSLQDILSIQDPTKVAADFNEKNAEDCKVRERVAELEMQNQQLAYELERQKHTTEALLRQLDHFTSKSYSSKSVSENNLCRKMMRE